MRIQVNSTAMWAGTQKCETRYLCITQLLSHVNVLVRAIIWTHRITHHCCTYIQTELDTFLINRQNQPVKSDVHFTLKWLEADGLRTSNIFQLFTVYLLIIAWNQRTSKVIHYQLFCGSAKRRYDWAHFAETKSGIKLHISLNQSKLRRSSNYIVLQSVTWWYCFHK